MGSTLLKNVSAQDAYIRAVISTLYAGGLNKELSLILFLIGLLLTFPNYSPELLIRSFTDNVKIRKLTKFFKHV